MSTTHVSRWWIAGSAALAATLMPLSASAHPLDEGPAGALFGLLAVAVLLSGLGLAVGCLGHTVSHVFRARSRATFAVLRAKPGWSLLAGGLVTLLSLGLLRVLQGAPALQLLVLGGFLLGLALLAVAAATRLAGQLVDPSLLDDELPALRVVVPAGLLLLGLNAVPLLGTLLFVGILLASIGAALLAYFVKPRAAAATGAGAGPVGAAPPAPAAPLPGEP
jgi:hypothetical protein